jgi:hypothetical protein
MKQQLAVPAVAIALAMAMPGPALAEGVSELDEIVLKNGSRIYGTVTSSEEGAIEIETDFAGTLTVNPDEVESLYTRGSMVVQMKDGTVIRDQPIEVEKERIVVTDTAGREMDYAVADILHINPEPWELGDGYKWWGLVNFAFKFQRGNTDTDDLDYKLDSFWRSLEDRYTLRAWGDLDKSNGVTNADNWTVLGKYDYFLSDKSYWGINALVESDEFKDLDLRYYAGPYYGRQWYETDLFTFSTEIGLVYTWEEFIVAEDQDYPGANWNIHMSSNYLGGDSRLYLDQIGIWDLDDMGDVVVKTTIGLGFPLLFGLEGAAEAVWEYDSGAQSGVDELDETYALRIGYAW